MPESLDTAGVGRGGQGKAMKKSKRQHATAAEKSRRRVNIALPGSLHRQLQAVAASCRGQGPSPEDRRNAALQAGCFRERRKRSETAAFLLASGGPTGGLDAAATRRLCRQP